MFFFFFLSILCLGTFVVFLFTIFSHGKQRSSYFSLYMSLHVRKPTMDKIYIYHMTLLFSSGRHVIKSVMTTRFNTFVGIGYVIGKGSYEMTTRVRSFIYVVITYFLRKIWSSLSPFLLLQNDK